MAAINYYNFIYHSLLRHAVLQMFQLSHNFKAAVTRMSEDEPMNQ